MRRINVMCLAAVLLTAGFAAAATVWNPAGNPDPNAIVDGTSNWNIAANWTNGVPVEVPEAEDTAGKAVFNVDGAAECIVNSEAVCNQLSMGDNGTTNGNFLRIVDGGSLLAVRSDWHAIGYNRSATLTVEAGGYVETGRQLMVGRDGVGGTGEVGAYPSYLIIDGGTVVIKHSLQLGNNDADKLDGGGIVYVNSGLLDIRNNLEMRNQAVSRLDIRYGTVIINGDRRGNLNTWTSGANPIVTAFGGAGTVVYDWNVTNPGKTTVTAISPLNPYPAYKETVGDGLVDLIWTNMDPNFPGDSVWVDVWFGTEPNKLSLAYTKEVAAGQDTETVQVFAPVIGTPPTTYYWQVDSYIYGADHINEPNMIEGDVFVFYVTDDFAPTVEIETPNTVTWVNEPVQLDATVSDTGASELFIQWTSSHPDNVTFIPNNTVEDPAVSVDSAVGPVTLTVTVWDALNPETDSDTMVLHVAADPCAAAGVAGVAASYPMNIAGDDCVINIQDLEALIADWLEDFALTEPVIDPRYNP